MKIALYPGTFDPVTFGHLDIMERACAICDELVVAVAPNASKQPTFSVEERKALIAANLPDSWGVRVTHFDELAVDFAESLGAAALIRGLRAMSDFEYEFQMTQMNRELNGRLETIFLMPSAEYFYTSSTLVKQVAWFDPERIEKFVPQNVAEALRALRSARTASEDPSS